MTRKYKISLERKKRIFAAFLTAVVLFLDGFSLLSTVVSADAPQKTPVVSIESEMKVSGNIATATVVTDTAISDAITVYYHTENRSAVAGVDYTAASGSITISNSTSATITVSISPSGNTYSATSGDGARYTREFIVVIDRAVNANVNGDRNTSVCRLNASLNIPITLQPGYAYADVYTQLGKNSISNWEVDDDSTEYKTNMFGSSYNGWAAYINKGLAQAYTTFTIDNLDHKVVSANTKVYYTLYDTAGNTVLYFRDDTCTEGGKELDISAVKTVAQGKNPHTSYGDDDLDVDNIKHSGYSVFYTDNRIGGPNEAAFFLVKPSAGTVNVSLSIQNTASYYHIMYTGTHYLRLFDTTAPYVTETYLDDSALASSGVLRLSVRFSEPVWSNSTAYSSVALKFLNADGSLSNTDYLFYYAGGNYTDTLYYECSVGTGLGIYGYQLVEADNKIVDLSYRVSNTRDYYANRSTGWPVGKTVTLKTPFLFTTPSVSISGGYEPGVFAVQHDVTIHTGSARCTVYTAWNREEADLYETSKYDFVEDYTGESKLVSFGDNGKADGKWYLHVMAVNRYGLRDVKTFGPFYLDRTSPDISYTVDVNNMYEKQFTVTVEDPGVFSSGLGELDLLLDGKSYVIWKDGELYDPDHVKQRDDNTFVYYSNIKENPGTNPDDKHIQDTRILDLMKKAGNSRQRFNYAFRVVDRSKGYAGGNASTTDFTQVTYDVRDGFKTAMYLDDIPVLTDASARVPGTTYWEPIITVGAGIPVYETGTDVSAVRLEPDASVAMEEGTKLYLIVPLRESEKKPAEKGKDVEHIYVGVKEGGSFVYYLVTTDPDTGAEIVTDTRLTLTPGYHEITPVLVMGGSSIDSEDSLVSETYAFYLTKDKQDVTPNAERAKGNLLLTNKVFQLPDLRFTYIPSEKSSASTVNYGAVADSDGKFSGGSPSPTFSTADAARRYLTMMEYQDMQLVTLTDTEADFLRSGIGSTIFVCADGENASTAQEGQLWIRYKRSSWTLSSDANGGWAYYFYAPSVREYGNVINVYQISQNLSQAVNAVVSYLLTLGETVNLVGDYVSVATGTPLLSDSQIHAANETFTKTFTGSVLEPAVIYEGDAEIYHNNAKYGGHTVPLATNMLLRAEKDTHLFFRGYTESETGFRAMKLDTDSEDTLRHLMGNPPSGLYVIREVSECGVHDFTVYVDTTMPEIQALVSGESKKISSGLATVPGDSFSFVGILNEDADPEAYVAIYTYSLRNFIAAYYVNDIAGVTLPIENYYIEVGDRSGNRFFFSVILSDTELEASVEENTSGTGIIVRCTNREEDEILRYEVRLNNKNLEVHKDELLDKGESFFEAGVYSVLIQDIFGKVKKFEMLFNFRAPEVTWSYIDNEGTPHGYDPDHPEAMVLLPDEYISGVYNVYTSTTLRFLMSDDLGTPVCVFDGLEEGDYTASSDGTLVTVKKLSNWSVNVFYAEHPENVITYRCNLDMQGPGVTGTYVAVEYNRDETEELNLAAKAAEIGDYIIPPFITYSKGAGSVCQLASGQRFSGNCITLSFDDPAGIREVQVLRDREPMEIDTTKFPLVFNEFGTYEITVYDNLGNMTYYPFTNEPPASGAFRYDGHLSDGGLDHIVYGHELLEMQAMNECESEILVTVGEKKYYYRFFVSDGAILQVFYQCAEGGGGTHVPQTVIDSQPVYAMADENAVPGVYRTVIIEDNFNVSACFDENGTAFFALTLIRGKAEVQMRNFTENGKEPAFLDARLSDELTDVPVKANGVEKELVHTGAMMYVTGSIEVSAIEDPLITSVEVEYSEDGEKWKTELLYTAGTTDPSSYFNDAEGMYRLTVINIFGNVNIVNFSLSGDFLALGLARYVGDSEARWTIKGEDAEIFSNNLITVSAYSEQVTFLVNGQVRDAQNQQEVLFITLDKDTQGAIDTEAGKMFVVEMIDAAGNRKKVTAYIGSDPEFDFDEAWITGYNEQALRRSEGYTNQKLSVDLTNASRVTVVSVFKDGEQIAVIYDSIGSEKVNADQKILADCVGTAGDGVYTVVFRDKYGDLTEKEIHYRETPTLSLSRTTSFSVNEEPYDLALALEKGFCSNRTLVFSTVSELYRFRIGGADVSLKEPKILEFTSSSGEGTFQYEVTYVDEYGFSYSFTAELERRNELIDASPLSMTTVDGEYYTAKDIVLNFGGDLTVLLSINGAEPIAYESGRVFRSDALYAFTVVDFAGNVQLLTVTHDSVAHFTVEDAFAELPVLNGGVVNAQNVVFYSGEGDTSFIRTAFLNGVEQKNFDTTVFSETGHWELLISDAVGNTAYFAFDLINHSLSEYHFETPYGYSVSEVWMTDASGNKQITPYKGKTLDLLPLENKVGAVSYGVIMLSDLDNTAVNFTVTIDNTPPKASAVDVDGNPVEDGAVTAFEVTFTGVEIGDTVSVYKDGELYSVTQIETDSDVPVISEGGKYEVKVTNKAGVSATFRFTKKYIANTATSVLVIIACIGLAICIFVGLMFRNRSKTDD